MPAISRFFGLVIAIYFDDHDPPHFHVRHADGQAKIAIENLEVLDSSLGRTQLRLALAWAELHQDELSDNCAGHAPVRHCSRSSRCDDWPDP